MKNPSTESSGAREGLTRRDDKARGIASPWPLDHLRSVPPIAGLSEVLATILPTDAEQYVGKLSGHVPLGLVTGWKLPVIPTLGLRPVRK